jgi:endonuclease/exonuclease/phosphatase family metal-dependent hydrolase
MLSASLLALCLLTPPEGAPPDAELLVATYNLRYASTTSPNSWAARRPAIRALLGNRDPDVIGTQEGLYQQLRDLDADLPEHDWIGLGREGGSRGEHMAIFYRRERLAPLELDHFWLSDTPDRIGSTSFGNELPRMVTWVRFLDRVTEKRVVVVNTHLDHVSAESRARSAELLRERISALHPNDALILTGDFNAAAGESAPYRELVEERGLVDAWTAASERGESLGTFAGWEEPRPDGARIDWILLRGPWEVLAADADASRPGGVWPSDHLPVFARLRLRASE